ncbi:hypothetical protein KGF56_002424 [Candida oxycetoniae]|uniref:FAD-binding FR-type domain-containing protein n=1 Tax=Candida oxycetoniae TaxID=497107 RepID=A0AAI9SXB5_9ASCO|nr:uncharacterized protein KGF56_002424 [Candida oxycetoniae]KAI3404794.2 hypothetical protein KGF56_002424 [Candida oxycetoniae]
MVSFSSGSPGFLDRSVAKRCARIGIAQIPAVFLLATKGDFITGVTGLTYERSTFLHIWFSFMMFTTVTFHVVAICYYWARPEFSYFHPRQPYYVYGILAFVTFVFLAFGNIRIIRKISFDASMVHHRAQSFIMLLMAFLHNNNAKAMVVLGVHLLVLDKVLGRIYGIIHSKKSPTKGWSEFELLDEYTMRVSIPIKINKSFNPNSWFGLIKFKYGNWLPGQHLYFNVRKVDFFQHHPFWISSLSEDGKMVIIIKKRNGFTKKLFDKIETLKEKQIEGTETEDDYIPRYRKKINQWVKKYKTNKTEKLVEENEEFKIPDYRKIVDPNIVILKVAFRGPSGAKFQPLVTFDSVAFFAQECGASFILPVCLDLLQTIERKEVLKDYLGRPAHPVLVINWMVKSEKQIYWYKHVLDRLLTFVKAGKLTFNVSIEEKADEIRQIDKDQEIDPLTPPCSEKKLEKADFEESALQKTSTSVTSVSSQINSTDYTLLNISNKSLDTNKELQKHIASVKYSDENHFRSMAVLSCGEDTGFGKEIEYSLQNYRWAENAPNIYFYNESYDS